VVAQPSPRGLIAVENSVSVVTWRWRAVGGRRIQKRMPLERLFRAVRAGLLTSFSTAPRRLELWNFSAGALSEFPLFRGLDPF